MALKSCASVPANCALAILIACNCEGAVIMVCVRIPFNVNKTRHFLINLMLG